MRNPFLCGPGGVVSADIAVPEHARELEFYAQILTTGAVPLWRDDLMNNRGVPIIGLGERIPEYSDLPLQWMPHFQVADVASSAAGAVELGGKELMHSRSEDGQSQWAALMDPHGAGFGIIPAVDDNYDPVQQQGTFGRISWLSLMTPDAASSRDFYQRVVGWDAEPIGDGETSVTKFEMRIDEATAAAEICQLSTDDNSLPKVWLIHIPVGDLTESLRRVGANSGEVVREYVDAGYAIIRDPVGVFIALCEE